MKIDQNWELKQKSETIGNQKKIEINLLKT